MMTQLHCRQWYDKLHRGAVNDLCTLGGFIVAVRDTLCMRPGGLLHGGHPCNGLLGFKNDVNLDSFNICR